MIRSTTIIYEVLRKYDLSPMSYMFCDIVYKYTSSNGFCDKTLTEIAEELNCSSRSLTRYIPDLCDKGFLDNVGSKSHPKYRTTPQWFKLVVSDGDEVISLEYQEICKDVIEYINKRYGNKYVPRAYEKRFKSILSKRFNGEPITGKLMLKVFIHCKDTWSEKYQSSVTPEVIFGNKFTEKYLIQYYEQQQKTYKTDRKNIAII